MEDFILKDIVGRDIISELTNIGYDKNYCNIGSNKFLYRNIKIYNLTPAQANILKQTAISVGADCATNKDVITGRIELSNVILGGNYSQLKKISEKLSYQPFKLKTLSENIKSFLIKKERKTKLVGILNVTPDSFSDGGKYFNLVDAEKHLVQMIEDGADVIDIGAESTKPYSKPVSDCEQIKRICPILEFIQSENINVPISVDTRSSNVAKYALENGASIINDVSGFNYDKNLANVVSNYDATVIIQHSLGTPENMQDSPIYQNIVEDVFFSLKDKIEYAKNIGIKNIIADPGIGFGKTKFDNHKILNHIEEFFSLNCPIMVGLSRKSLLGLSESGDNDLKDALSLALSYPLLEKKIDYLRVHNVKLHKVALDKLFAYTA